MFFFDKHSVAFLAPVGETRPIHSIARLGLPVASHLRPTSDPMSNSKQQVWTKMSSEEIRLAEMWYNSDGMARVQADEQCVHNFSRGRLWDAQR